MTGKDPAEVIGRHIAAFNAGDVEALISGFTEDAVWVTGTTIVRGRAELTELFAAAIAGLRPTLVVVQVITANDRVACELTETLTASDGPHSFRIAGFYRLRDGRIASARIYREGSAEID
ncbi:nuclear transport factor 2 family protein [Actinocrinis puniceicyclus]|uniref:Nuclear transport factor 2 family protein n=1 Tax=Actinocrinis puniceicyclus TaxID=977794 RepID=A0A8J8BB12_9ACTN|nr:nuclear transport factor 2 family protein [Actinocrinis puniceicyclus]MBS2961960.1 nuclear transport factor 2 family protein [Actinocrinis puniceicyclus]